MQLKVNRSNKNAAFIKLPGTLMRRALLAIFFLLAGCQPDPPDNAEIQRWFDAHFSELSELATLGEQHKALRRAETSLKDYKTYYSEPSKADLDAEKRVYEIIEMLKVDFVAYWRSGDDGNEVLRGMTVPYYRWGLALGGYSKCIHFDADNLTTEKEPGSFSTYIYLNKPGWFIETSDTR